MLSNDSIDDKIETMSNILLPRLKRGGQAFSLQKEILQLQNGEDLAIAYLLGDAGAIFLVAERYKGKEYTKAEQHIIQQYISPETPIELVRRKSFSTIFYKDGIQSFRHVSKDTIPKEKAWKTNVFTGNPSIKEYIHDADLSIEEKEKYFSKVEENTWNRSIALSSQESHARTRSLHIQGEPIVWYVQGKSARREEAVLTYKFNESILKEGKKFNEVRRKYTPEVYAIISNKVDLGEIIRLDKGASFQ